MKTKADLIFFTLLGLLIGNTIYQTIIMGHYNLSINNYAGFVAWFAGLVLWLTRYKNRRYLLGFILILGTLNILNFGIGQIRVGVAVGDISDPSVEGLQVDPIILLLLIAFFFVNKASIKRVIKHTINGTDEEQESNLQKQIDFYLQKFSACSPEEFESIYQNFNDYPPEAQSALAQIRGNTNTTTLVS